METIAERMRVRRLNPLLGGIFAIVASVATLGFRVALSNQLRGRPTLIVFVLPIILSAYTGGLVAGLLATVICCLGAGYFLLPRAHSFWIESAVDRWDLLFLLLAGLLISVLNGALHRARRRADIATRDQEEARNALVQSQALQTAIFNSANFSSIATDAQGIIQIFNVGAERMLGYTAAEVMNKITPADISDPREVIARAQALTLEQATPIAPGFEALVFKASRRIEDIYELTYVRKDGSRFPAVVSVTALRDAEDEIIGYLLIGTDNTARKQAEEARQTSEARYRTLFEYAPDGIVIADASSNYLDANPSICRLLGYTREELTGLNASDIVAPAEVPHIGEALGVIHSKSPYEREWQFRRKDGSLVSAEVLATVMPDGNLMGVIRDVTASKQVNDALRKSETQLQTILENISEAVVVSDLNGQLLHFNHAALEMMGYASLDEGRRKFSELADTFELSSIEGEGWSVAQWPLARILQGEKLHDLEARMRRVGTEWQRIYSFGGTIAHDAAGNPRMAIVTFRDITERKRAEDLQRTIEARVSGIVNSAMDAIISIDAKQQIVLFNAAAEKMFRCPAEAALGQPIDKFIPERFREQHLHHIEGFGKTGTTSRSMRSMNALSGLRSDGEEFPIEAAISQVEFAGQRIFTVILRDITERQRTEAEAALLALIVQSSSDAIIGKDLNSIVTSWNRSAEKMFGYSADEIVGRSIAILIPPDRHDDEEQIQARVQRGERVEHFETERLRKNGSRITVSVTVSPIKDANGRVIGSSKAVRDITEIKRAAEVIHQLNTDLERRVVQRTAQLQTANNELEAFSYSVSHDLRAPLRSIDGFSKAILEDYGDKLDSIGQGYLSRVRASSQRMGQLIDDMLNLSRVSRGDLLHESTDLSQIGREVIAECRGSCQDRDVRVEIADGLIADADPRLMRVVLTNLLGNAWKFTSRTEHATIEFGSSSKDGQTEYFVRDNGAGFDMTYAGKLFGAFQRLHSDKEFPGTGIGLATIQRIIHRHNGSVRANGKPGEGATFYFTLEEHRDVQNRSLQSTM